MSSLRSKTASILNLGASPTSPTHVEAHTPLQAPFVPLKGIVWKWTNFMKGWRPRYFVASVPGVLEYYSSNRTKKKLATISLSDAIISPSRAKEDQFNITYKKRNYHIRTPTKEERDKWVEVLHASKDLYLLTISKAKVNPLPSQSPEIVELMERLQELQSYKVRFIAQIRQLKLSNKQSSAHIEDLASELVLTVEECTRLIEKNVTSRKISISGSRKSLGDDDSVSFYSCMDRSEEEDDDETESSDDSQTFETDEEFPTLASMASPRGNSRSGQSETGESSRHGSTVKQGHSVQIPVLSQPNQKEVASNMWVPVMKGRRRQTLPHPKAAKRASLWGVLKDAVGKDLSRITLPANWNEPLGSLQRACEELEYHDLLQKGMEFADPTQRMLYVAAFAVSSYGYTRHRTSKPFNPMLGESYEFEDDEIRFISEQVSHHPPITAFHTQAKNYQVFGEVQIKNKFWGKSVEVIPVGSVNAVFGDNKHRYSWNKVTTTVNNIVIGSLWLTHQGEMKIRNHATGDTCTLEFHTKGWFGNITFLVTGQVCDPQDRPIYYIYGMWNEYLSYLPASDGHDPNNPDAPWIRIWTVRPFPPDCEQFYNFSYFAMKLNEITPDLRAVLPVNDSRLRPDQRLLEDGDYDQATVEKLRLEEKQREMRRARERAGQEWNPLWFKKQLDPALETEIWVYTDEYWQKRERKDWSNVVDLFA